jgi:signal recognition particle GTPase
MQFSTEVVLKLPLGDKDMGFFDKYSVKRKKKVSTGFAKTKENFFSKITKALGKSTVDDEVLDNLEEALCGSRCWDRTLL